MVVLRLFTSLALMFCLFSVPARAEDGISDIAVSSSVIDLQLHAIQSKNADVVYSYASDDAKAQYKTPEAYLRMIRHTYKVLYDHESYSILASWDVHGLRVHKVEFVLYDGRVHTALIRFKQGEDKHWSMVGAVVLGEEAQPI